MPDIPEEAVQAADGVELTDGMLAAYETVLDALRPFQTPDGTLHASAARVAARVVSTLARAGMVAVSAEDLDIVMNRGDQVAGWSRFSDACERLRAALPERTENA